VVPRTERAECALLKAVAARYVMARAGATAAQAREREVVRELVDLLCARPDALEPLAAEAYRCAPDDTGRLRAVVDHVASLTDGSAAQLHGQLSAA
jgi:dGTPase